MIGHVVAVLIVGLGWLVAVLPVALLVGAVVARRDRQVPTDTRARR